MQTFKTKESSNIASAVYSRNSSTLVIRFTSGHSYIYRDVPESVFQDLVRAKSIGRQFHRTVRSAGFKFERLSK